MLFMTFGDLLIFVSCLKFATKEKTLKIPLGFAKASYKVLITVVIPRTKKVNLKKNDEKVEENLKLINFTHCVISSKFDKPIFHIFTLRAKLKSSSFF